MPYVSLPSWCICADEDCKGAKDNSHADAGAVVRLRLTLTTVAIKDKDVLLADVCQMQRPICRELAAERGAECEAEALTPLSRSWTLRAQTSQGSILPKQPSAHVCTFCIDCCWWLIDNCFASIQAIHERGLDAKYELRQWLAEWLHHAAWQAAHLHMRGLVVRDKLVLPDIAAPAPVIPVGVLGH